MSDWVLSVCSRIGRHLGLKVERDDGDQERVITQHGMSSDSVLQRLAYIAAKIKYIPRSVVDVGASDGRWTRACLRHFPAARYLLIEPLPNHAIALNALSHENANVEYIRCALSRAAGRGVLMEHGFQSSMFCSHDDLPFGSPVQVMVTTLDSIIAERRFSSPDYIKLDIEGSELDALHGAELVLRTCSMVQVEMNLMPFRKGMPLMHEVVSFMGSKGYRILDVVGVYARPLDGLPAQCECFFVNTNKELVKDWRWSDRATWC